MVIIPYVCAEFRDREGKSIYRTTPEMLRTLVDVPEDKWKAMQEDNLLAMLMADGSIKTPETVAQQKLLAQEPMLGMTAEGRSAVTVQPETPEQPEKSGKETKGKPEVKTEEKPAESKPSGAEQKK